MTWPAWNWYPTYPAPPTPYMYQGAGPGTRASGLVSVLGDAAALAADPVTQKFNVPSTGADVTYEIVVTGTHVPTGAPIVPIVVAALDTAAAIAAAITLAILSEQPALDPTDGPGDATTVTYDEPGPNPALSGDGDPLLLTVSGYAGGVFDGVLSGEVVPLRWGLLRGIAPTALQFRG